MEVYVARQPIFDSEMNVFAYELLFRSGPENYYDTTLDGTHSTLSVITSSLMVFGFETLTSGKPAFINFTKKLLLRGMQTSLPRELCAIEVIEGIEPDLLVLQACHELKEKGYLIALDDFILHDTYNSLLDVADIIKVDFMNTTVEERQAIVDACSGRDIALLAEKVENAEHMQEALSMGYSYFQGYFLERPTVLQSRAVPGSRLNFMQALKHANQDAMDLDMLEEIIKQDLSLTYKLIRFTNSTRLSSGIKVNPSGMPWNCSERTRLEAGPRCCPCADPVISSTAAATALRSFALVFVKTLPRLPGMSAGKMISSLWDCSRLLICSLSVHLEAY